MKLLFIRHGRPDTDPEEKRYIGITDVPLSDEGRAQAVMLGDRLVKEQDISRIKIYTSPLLRCVETAAIISDRLYLAGSLSRPVIIDGLHEIDLGEWDGRSVSEIRESCPDEYEARGRDLWNYRTPGGETFAEAGERFCRAVEEIKAGSGDGDVIAVVSHAGVIRAGMSLMTGEAFDRWMKKNIPFAATIYAEGEIKELR